MALTLLILASILFYSTSRYFPLEQLKMTGQFRAIAILVAAAICFMSLYLFSISYDLTTALMIWMIAIMTLLSSVVLSVKLYPKSIWAWGTISMFIVILDVL